MAGNDRSTTHVYRVYINATEPALTRVRRTA
jgi:hypothetical protein